MFLFPPLSEQESIAEILSVWDEAIANLAKLVEVKKKIKKILMQRLLAGEIKFKEFGGNWQEKELKPILRQELFPVSKPDKAYKSLGIRSHGKGIFQKMGLWTAPGAVYASVGLVNFTLCCFIFRILR